MLCKKFFTHANVPALVNACDLGCPTTYHGVAKLGKLLERFEDAKSKLLRIQHAKWSLDTKVHVVCSSVLPGAFYDCELLAIGQQHLDSLRVCIAYALLGERSHSMNSAIFLTCTCIQHVDPHMYVLWRSLTAAQQFLQRCDLFLKTAFLHIMANPSKVAGQSHGAGSAPREYLLRLGLKCSPTGDILVSAYRTCNLATTSRKEIMKYVRDAWQDQLLLMHTNRKNLFEMPAIDPFAMHQVMKPFPSKQKIFVVARDYRCFPTQFTSCQVGP